MAGDAGGAGDGLGDMGTMPSPPDLDANLLPAEPAKQILRQLGEQGEPARPLVPGGHVEGEQGLGRVGFWLLPPLTSMFLFPGSQGSR